MNSTNIPVQLTSFIGRERELADVARLISTNRLVTLTGAGGCGKTQLAIQTANRVKEAFEDGVWLVNLAPLRDPALVPQIVTHTLGLRPVADRPLLESLISFVQPKQMLLVLDNCEHLSKACARLVQILLSKAPGLQVLATSREALALAGETIYPVSGLAWPVLVGDTARDDHSDIDLQELLAYDAVRLFVERVHAITPAFVLTSGNAPAIIEICRRLDGLPLALELASARANVLSVQEIATHLNERFTLLTTGNRSDLEPRHSTLRAAMDWSYALLNPGEQTLLNRLAVFAAGCSLDTAEVICSGDGIVAEQMLDLLSSLVTKSLLVAETVGRSQARYHLLETIREYTLEKLVETGEVGQRRDCHLDLFLARVEEAVPQQFNDHQQFWLDWMEEEHDNLRSALVWALESKQIEAGLRLASGLVRFWEIHGNVQEGLGWIERLLAQADDNVSLAVHVNALVFAVFLSMVQGNAHAATAFAREAVELAEAVGDSDSPILAFALDGLASAAKTTGDYQTAFNITEQNIRFYRKSGPPFYLGMTLLSQGENALQLGYYAIARERLSESLALARQAGDTFRIAHSLNTLGDLLRLEQNYTEAASAYESGAVLLRELGAQRDLASLLSNLGYARLYLGDIEHASRLFTESMTIHQAQQNSAGITECLIGFAAMAIHHGQPAVGMRLLAAAAALSGQPSGSKWRVTRMEFERYRDIARGRLTEASYQAEQMEGGTLSLEQAVEYTQSVEIHSRTATVSRTKLGDLTEREREVTILIAEGKTNAEIAQELVLSKRTVEKHAANILSKLGFTNRSQVVRWAIEQGLSQTSR